MKRCRKIEKNKCKLYSYFSKNKETNWKRYLFILLKWMVYWDSDSKNFRGNSARVCDHSSQKICLKMQCELIIIMISHIMIILLYHIVSITDNTPKILSRNVISCDNYHIISKVLINSLKFIILSWKWYWNIKIYNIKSKIIFQYPKLSYHIKKWY